MSQNNTPSQSEGGSTNNGEIQYPISDSNPQDADDFFSSSDGSDLEIVHVETTTPMSFAGVRSEAYPYSIDEIYHNKRPRRRQYSLADGGDDDISVIIPNNDGTLSHSHLHHETYEDDLAAAQQQSTYQDSSSRRSIYMNPHPSIISRQRASMNAIANPTGNQYHLHPHHDSPGSIASQENDPRPLPAISVFLLYHSDPTLASHYTNRETIEYLARVNCPVVFPRFPTYDYTGRGATGANGAGNQQMVNLRSIGRTMLTNEEIVLSFTPLLVAKQIVENIRMQHHPLHNIYAMQRFNVAFPISICGGFVSGSRTTRRTLNEGNPIVLDTDDDVDGDDGIGDDDNGNDDDEKTHPNRSNVNSDQQTMPDRDMVDRSDGEGAPDPIPNPFHANTLARDHLSAQTRSTPSSSSSSSSSQSSDAETSESNHPHQTAAQSSHPPSSTVTNANDMFNLIPEAQRELINVVRNSHMRAIRSERPLTSEALSYLYNIDSWNRHREWYYLQQSSMDALTPIFNFLSANISPYLSSSTESTSSHHGDALTLPQVANILIQLQSGFGRHHMNGAISRLRTGAVSTTNTNDGADHHRANDDDDDDIITVDPPPVSSSQSSTSSDDDDDDDSLYGDASNDNDSIIPSAAAGGGSQRVSSVTPGTPPKTSNSMPVQQTKKRKRQEDSNSTILQRCECSLCISRITKPSVTKCGHLFCHACIRRAVAILKTCPTCRRPLDLSSIFRIYG